jgi:hypothetical protein
MTKTHKPNKIKLRLTGGRKDLDAIKPYLDPVIDQFIAHSEFMETSKKLRRKGNTPLLEITYELTEAVVINLPEGTNLTKRPM